MLLLLPQPRGTTGTLPCNLHAASQPVPCPPFPALKYPNLTLFAPRCLSQHGLLHSCFFFPLLPAPQLLFSHFVKQDLLLLFVQLCQELRVNIHITQNLLQHGDSKKKQTPTPASNYTHYSEKTPRMALRKATCKGALPRLPAQERFDSCSLRAGIFHSSLTGMEFSAYLILQR